MFEATPRTFSILPKNLMKNIEIHIFFLVKNKKPVEIFFGRITNYWTLLFEISTFFLDMRRFQMYHIYIYRITITTYCNYIFCSFTHIKCLGLVAQWYSVRLWHERNTPPAVSLSPGNSTFFFQFFNFFFEWIAVPKIFRTVPKIFGTPLDCFLNN